MHFSPSQQKHLIGGLLLCALLPADLAAQSVALRQIESELLTDIATLKLVAADFNQDNFTDAAALRFDSSDPTRNRVIVQWQRVPVPGEPVRFETSQILPARFPVDLAVADLDNDGDQDLLVAQDDGSDALAVWLNYGGTQQGALGVYFRDPSRFSAELISAVRVLKLVGSGASPLGGILLVGGTGRPSKLYSTQLVSQQPPTFLDVQTIMHPGAAGAEIGDFNGDQRDDILFYGTQTQLWLNSGSMIDPMEAITSTPFAATGTVFSATARDLDGDNDLDLVLATATGEKVYRHDGLGANGEPQFSLSQTLGSGSAGVSRAYAWIDADGDGSEELVAARSGESPVYSRDGLIFSPTPTQAVAPAETLQVAALTTGASPYLWTAALESSANALWRTEISTPVLPVVSFRGVSSSGIGGYYDGNTISTDLGVLPASSQPITLSLELSGIQGPIFLLSAQVPAGRVRSRIEAHTPSVLGSDVQEWTIALTAVTPALAATIGTPDQALFHTYPDSSDVEFQLGCYLGCMFRGNCGPAQSPDAARSPGGSGGLMGTAAELTLLQRLRDERMATTPGGSYYIDLYQALQLDLYVATFGSPGFYLDLWQLKDAWMPAMSNLVDGDGSLTITTEMQDRLLAALLQFETHGSSALQAAIARERSALDLEHLAGAPISSLQQHWEASPIFADGFD